MIAAVEELGIEVTPMSASEHSQACGQFVDAVDQATIRHMGDDRLENSIKSAATRPLGDSWAWSRKNSTGNISPLVSATLALSAAIKQGDREFTASWV